MKKILLISNGYPSKTNPHYMPFIKTIHDCIVLAGHDIDNLVLNTNFTDKKSKYINYFKYYKQLFLEDYSKFDIVYIHIFPFSFIPLLFKLHKMNNLIIHWHGVDIYPRTKKDAFLNKLSYRFIRNVKKHIVPSQYYLGEVVKRLGIPKNTILVSPSGGVDTEFFTPIKKDNTDTISLGYASGMITEKGIDLVVKLIKETEYLKNQTQKKIKFIFIKYGIEVDKYLNILKDFDNVEIIDPIANKKMNGFYNKLDIFLFPTRRSSESLGLVGLEAMSCDVPVVGTNDFAIKDYVVSGVSGEKFNKGDYSSFREAVITCITNIESYNPREIVEESYSMQHVVSQYKHDFTK